MQRESKLSLIFLIAFATVCFSQDLTLSIVIGSETVVLGLPVQFKVQLYGDENFTLHGQFGPCDGHTQIVVKDDSGNVVDLPNGVLQCARSKIIALDSFAKIEYPGSAEFHVESFWPVGKYHITVRYSSKGPYFDHWNDTDVLPVEGIWIGELTSNEVEVEVRSPQGDDQSAFLSLGPSPEESRSPEKLSWFLKLKEVEILKDYPKSNYAAWLRWKWGKISFESYDGDKSSSQEDIGYQDFMKSVDETEPVAGATYYKEKIQRVIDFWEPLYRDFPAFSKRSFVLRGLSQAFIRNGEYQKAKPLITELLERYPNSEEAKKAQEYKEIMIEKGLW